VSTRKYSCIHFTARSEYSCRFSAGMRSAGRCNCGDEAAPCPQVVPDRIVPVKIVPNKIALDKTHVATPGLTPHWPTLRLPCPTHRAPKRTLPGKADFHAVFISGSPKLPCPRPQGYLSRLQGTTMSIDIKHLRLQPFLPIWHPTCIRNREVRRRRELGAGEFKARRCVSAGRLSLTAGLPYS
jgi:hypothetical protein